MHISFLLSDNGLAVLACATLLMVAGMIVHLLHSRQLARTLPQKNPRLSPSVETISPEAVTQVLDQNSRAA